MKKRLILAALVLLVVSVAMVVLYRTEPGEESFLPRCIFHQATGLHCTGCGMTRACHALLHLRFGEALRQNPLVVLALPLVVAAVLIEGWAWILGDRYRGPRVRMPGWAYGVLLGTILVYWVLRNIPVWPLTLLAPH